jgi:hypothetical protein
MNKKYMVRLTAQERDDLATVVKKLKGTSEKVRRAQILLKADADDPNWTDRRIAEAFGCRRQTVENIRQRRVEQGFRDALDRSKRKTTRVEKPLNGEQEARIIATWLGSPPPGYVNWTLRLLARKVVESGIVESVSYETVRRTSKKRHDEPQDRVLGHSARGRPRVRGPHGRSAGDLRQGIRPL